MQTIQLSSFMAPNDPSRTVFIDTMVQATANGVADAIDQLKEMVPLMEDGSIGKGLLEGLIVCLGRDRDVANEMISRGGTREALEAQAAQTSGLGPVNPPNALSGPEIDVGGVTREPSAVAIEDAPPLASDSKPRPSAPPSALNRTRRR